MPDPSNVFGLPLENRTPTPQIGRAGQGEMPVCYLRPVLSGDVTAPATITVTTGIWDDSVNVPTNLYVHKYDWYMANAATPTEFINMGASSIATPNISPATTTATKVICQVTSVNTLTGQIEHVWTAPVTVT